MVSPVMGQAGCPGLEPDCLKPRPAGTWVGVALACIMVQFHVDTGPRRVAEAKADTREQGRE